MNNLPRNHAGPTEEVARTPWARAASSLRLRLARDAQDFRRRWDGDADRRGVVLVMTMLMITLLTLLGSAAIVQTSSDIRDSGSHRVERVVYRIAEAATMGSVGLAGQMNAKFDDLTVSKSGVLTEDDFAGSLLDLNQTGFGSFGRELNNLGAAKFTIQVSPPELSSSVAGYQAGKYCFQSYRMVAVGHIGNADSKNERERAAAGESGLVAQVVVGPSLCAN